MEFTPSGSITVNEGTGFKTHSVSFESYDKIRHPRMPITPRYRPLIQNGENSTYGGWSFRNGDFFYRRALRYSYWQGTNWENGFNHTSLGSELTCYSDCSITYTNGSTIRVILQHTSHLENGRFPYFYFSVKGITSITIYHTVIQYTINGAWTRCYIWGNYGNWQNSTW